MACSDNRHDCALLESADRYFEESRLQNVSYSISVCL